jgi:tRNA A37 threonylcarbamoyladenosine synthetase subunit TsaC/SUA5/YrdC
LVDGGAAPIAQPSTVIDLCGADVKLIREGAMPFADIVRIAGAS